ncbi:MAG TPA: SDR family oxidoreductase [Cyclobacteriaceae bacterium]|jgi:short-subunit dehydrogenase|nr:SDR family oxidoreductase [Cytophagales bacterium]HRE65859.1 SDR family oxidoreductase [Cyclobacteriaceae bacterium]HRF33703.1 SDR family oxidoreductase [Cyclobacteriaceae bacterium]
MKYYSGKVVWITGASSGIGEALTYELANLGARIILSARRKEELERVKGNCPVATQANIKILPLDLSQPSTLNLCTEAAIQLFGQVDILINNGGISQRSLGKETQLEVDRKVMEVDYFGTIGITKNLLPHFLSRKAGHIVTISSVMGKIGTPYRTGYAAAKHALHGFFDSLRAELWKDSKDIHVTIICPGWIRTNITMHAVTGNGTTLNKMDGSTQTGMAPNVFAPKALRAIARKREEVYIGGFKEVLAIYLKRFMPRTFSRVIRKAQVR